MAHALGPYTHIGDPENDPCSQIHNGLALTTVPFDSEVTDGISVCVLLCNNLRFKLKKEI